MDQCPTVARQAHLHLAGSRRGHESASQSLTRARARGAHRKTCERSWGTPQHGSVAETGRCRCCTSALPFLGRFAAKGRATSPGRAVETAAERKPLRKIRRCVLEILKMCYRPKKRVTFYLGTKLFTWTISGLKSFVLGCCLCLSFSSVPGREGGNDRW